MIVKPMLMALCERGKRFYALKMGHHTTRVSMIAALQNREVIAPLTFVCYCNRQVFEMWVAQVLVPTLKPGQTVILDNASFHKGVTIFDLIAQAGCELLYLPREFCGGKIPPANTRPYSPALNDIEHCWFPLKNTIRKSRSNFDSFRAAVDAAFA